MVSREGVAERPNPAWTPKNVCGRQKEEAYRTSVQWFGVSQAMTWRSFSRMTRPLRLGASLALLTDDQYVMLAEALGEDQRVIDLWGLAKARFQVLAWKGALRA